MTYEQAKARVDATPELASHADYILADWNEGDEHWDWVVSALVAEIVDWATFTCDHFDSLPLSYEDAVNLYGPPLG